MSICSVALHFLCPLLILRCSNADKNTRTEYSWGFIWTIILGLAAAGVAGYAVYKYRIRRYMDSEIRAIMAQYMPLDNQGEIPSHTHASRGSV